MERLYIKYSAPLYAAVRRSGKSPDEAGDLLQEFFAVLIERGTIARADPDVGRFRAFLQHCLGQFLKDQHRKSVARKRGGDRPSISLVDPAVAERMYVAELAEHRTPEKEFERQWAMTVYDAAMRRLRDEYDDRQRLAEFESLRGLLHEPERGEIAETARKLGLKDSSLRKRLERLRRKYRDAFLKEVAATVLNSDEVEDEARYLIERLG